MTQRAPESKDETELTEGAAGKAADEAADEAAAKDAPEAGAEAAGGDRGADEETAGGVEPGSEVTGETDVETLRRRVEAAEAALEAAVREKEEYFDRWLRLQAEFDNYRKRTRKEMEESRTRGAEELIVKLLPVIDNLERAIAAGEAAAHSEASGRLVEGVRMVHRQFLTVLEGVGVTPVQAVGNPFDPNLHEAVAYEASDEHPEGTVIEEMQRGYVLGGRVLRPSMVKVAGGSGNKEATKDE